MTRRPRTSTPVEMKRTWLIQRLQAPRSGGLIGVDNPFSFGGGLRNGGLSAEAMTLLRSVWSFDYMGSAEFEFGAVPKALDGLARDHANLTAGTVDVDLATVPPHWSVKDRTPTEGTATVYFLARREHRVEVEARIRTVATDEMRLKDPALLRDVLRPAPGDRWTPDVQGWLELDNGFLFFTDQVMWQRAAALFGVEVST